MRYSKKSSFVNIINKPQCQIKQFYELCVLPGGKIESITLTDLDDNLFAFSLDFFSKELKEFFDQVLN